RVLFRSSPAPAPAAAPAPAETPAASPPSTNTAAKQYDPPAPKAAAPAPGATSPTARNDQMRLSPAVRRLAAEYQLDLAAVNGSGRNGRITRRNVLEFIQARQQSGATAPAAASGGAQASASGTSVQTAQAAARTAATPAPASHTAQPGTTVPFTRIRRLTAEHMVRSKATSPHVLQAVEVDFQRVDQVRKTVRD